MFFYFKNNRVKMISEEKLDCDLEFIKKTPTILEKEKLEQNYIIWVKDGKLEWETPQHIKNKEKPTTEQLKDLVEKAKTVDDIKNVIKLLLQ